MELFEKYESYGVKTTIDNVMDSHFRNENMKSQTLYFQLLS